MEEKDIELISYWHWRPTYAELCVYYIRHWQLNLDPNLIFNILWHNPALHAELRAREKKKKKNPTTIKP